MHLASRILWLANSRYGLAFADRAAFNRGVNRNLPWLLLVVHTRGGNLTADLNHIITNLIIISQHISDDIDAITFGNSRKI